MRATIWHNPKCGTSRNALALLHEAGADINIVEYIKTPPSRERLAALYEKAGIAPREGLRTREPAAKALIAGGADDAAILDAMIADPILIERPLVETDRGVRLARPADRVREIL